MHSRTVYFPLIAAEALMIEPTETEGKENLDMFADTMLKTASHGAPVKRLDEVKVAKDMALSYAPGCG